MPNQATPKCPLCRTAKFVQLQGTANHNGLQELGYCSKCKGTFDALDPEEGGDYSTFNPAARLERAERSRGRQFPRR
jgi:hypothetical protein